MTQRPHEGPTTRAENLNKLMKLRDEFAAIASQGRYVDAASREWGLLPIEWRIVLLMLTGMEGVTLAPSVQAMAARSWHELPIAEREALRQVVRIGVPYVARLSALAARV